MSFRSTSRAENNVFVSPSWPCWSRIVFRWIHIPHDEAYWWIWIRPEQPKTRADPLWGKNCQARLGCPVRWSRFFDVLVLFKSTRSNIPFTFSLPVHRCQPKTVDHSSLKCSSTKKTDPISSSRTQEPPSKRLVLSAVTWTWCQPTQKHGAAIHLN